MNVTHKITMDLTRPTNGNRINVVEGDKNSRIVNVHLYENSVSWRVPTDASVLIKWERESGVGGEYSQLSDGSSAWSSVGNVLTITLSDESTEYSGNVRFSIVLTSGDSQISTFAIVANVHAVANGKEETNSGTSSSDISKLQKQIGNLSELETENKSNLVAAINEVASSDSSQNAALTEEQINALDGMFKVCAYDDSKDVSGAYATFLAAFGITDTGGGEGEPDTPVEPDEPVIPEVTLTSISATYSGGDAAVGTAVTDLTGIVVTAHYSDGSTETVTGYTLSGTIAEGSNTITVSYGGKTATFTVTGVAESEPASYTRVAYLEGDGASGIATNFRGNTAEHTLFDVKVDLMYNNAWCGIVGQVSNQKLLGIRQKSIYWSGMNQEMFDTLTSEDAEPIPVHIVEETANVITVYDDNGNSIGTIEGTASETSNYFGLFGYGSAFADRVDNYSKCRIREVTFTRSGEIVKHYIPVLDSDRTPCMYETVDGEFLYNVGTGTFTAGEVI